MSSQHQNYIVVFNKDVSDEEITSHVEEIEKSGGKLNQRYTSKILRGFSASIPEDCLKSSSFTDNGKIKYIEPDGEVSIQPIDTENN